MISQEKRYILIPLQKLLKNVRDLGKLMVAKGFKNLPKVQKIAQYGHTDCNLFRMGEVNNCTDPTKPPITFMIIGFN